MLFNVMSVRIFVRDLRHDRIELVAGTQLSNVELDLPMRDCLVGEACNTLQTLTCDQANAQPGYHHDVDQMTGLITHNMLCTPIMQVGREEAAGTLQLINKQDQQFFDELDELCAEELATQLAAPLSHLFRNNNPRIPTSANTLSPLQKIRNLFTF
uniref:GAF domain-containing protein n=1 Tax=Magnetococcus massalia (strain MO-1) TaxID=451514 RepID=A0A1S7LK34_MAGMO|nr:protein of unknown function [Candidatus Magnetococcus massalia]